MCVCVCAGPHTVYTPVETISDSPPDTQGRRSERDTGKRGKSVEEDEVGGGGGTESSEEG